MRLSWALVGLLVLAPTPPPPDDVYVLSNGDRVSGKTLLKGKNALTVQTGYGRLVLPRAKIERILWGDGHEEILNAPPPRPPPPPPPVRLVLVVTGKLFWQAWTPPPGASVDPTLRFAATLDEEAAVTYVDSKLDPTGEIPGALVNSFSFHGEDLAVVAAQGVLVSPPETRPGRTVLRIDLPAARAGHRRLRLSYQTNTGTEGEPAWKDVVGTSLELELKPDAPTFVEVHQDRGNMEFSGGLFSRRRMKNVETFRMDARALGESERPAPPALDTQPDGF